MINVSFYLLNPRAVSQSPVYASISNKVARLRFATGQSFIASYCNARKKKGAKELIKKNTTFYFEYRSILDNLRDTIIRIEMNFLKENKKPSLEQIRDAFYLHIGKIKSESEQTFDDVFRKFISSTESQWSLGSRKHFITLKNHLTEFEKTYGAITLHNLNEDLWRNFRDNYFVKQKKFGNSSTNSNLKKLKQFMKFADKKQFLKCKIDFDELRYLEEIEPFKIALKEPEVETLLKLNLSNTPRLDKVRDLFALEILTGQRFSDIPKLLDNKHVSQTNIQIYQNKTGEKVTIPLHPKLKKHLKSIFKKYPQGFPILTNQKFNEYLTEICILAKFNKIHSWVTQSGKERIPHSDFRYNLISSHTGRRTFCTLALKSGIHHEMIMKVSGHKKYDQFREYVKVDDDDLDLAFNNMLKKTKLRK
ncbi:MAG: hypothetical protein POELPBGB_03594 [Bacteroidia bacterium]|nr:hypothetical protein [Bacteroidia bacterium]